MTHAHRVLVPIELPDPDPVPPALVAILGDIEVVVLGHYGLPEQTPPSAAREQFEATAQETLERLSRPFTEAGAPVSTRLVFRKARGKTIDRVAVEEDCDVILTPGRVEEVSRILVPLRGDANLERVLSFVTELLVTTGASVTLFHAGKDDEPDGGEELLADAAAHLTAAGVAVERIDRQRSTGADVGSRIVELGETHDLLVLGETEPSLRERILGAIPAQVTADTDDPAFVVRAMGEA